MKIIKIQTTAVDNKELRYVELEYEDNVYTIQQNEGWVTIWKMSPCQSFRDLKLKAKGWTVEQAIKWIEL